MDVAVRHPPLQLIERHAEKLADGECESLSIDLDGDLQITEPLRRVINGWRHHDLGQAVQVMG